MMQMGSISKGLCNNICSGFVWQGATRFFQNFPPLLEQQRVEITNIMPQRLWPTEFSQKKGEAFAALLTVVVVAAAVVVATTVAAVATPLRQNSSLEGRIFVADSPSQNSYVASKEPAHDHGPSEGNGFGEYQSRRASCASL